MGRGNPNPSPKTRIKKGQVLNPLGGAAHNPLLRKVRRLAAHEVAEIGSLVLAKNIHGLKSLIERAKKDPNHKASALKIWIATVAYKGVAKGDAHALDVLLNRLIGRTKESIEITGKDGGPVDHRISKMTKEERLAELARLRKARKEAGDD